MTQNEVIETAIEQLGILKEMIGEDYPDQGKFAASIARMLKVALKQVAQ